MTIFEAIVLGLVQGLTEFLPVSSSGHLTILQAVFGIEENNLLFDVLLHLGTLFSVLICYWRDIVGMVSEFFKLIGDLIHGELNLDKTPMRRQMIMVIIATIPMVAAVFFDDYIEANLSTPLIVGFMLIITAALLLTADLHGFGRKTAANATWLDSLLVGLMQLVAIVPGISRSGSVITASALRGYSRAFAVKFAFIMSIPVIVGANIFKVSEAVKTGLDKTLILPCVIGVAVAFAAGIAAIKFMSMLIKKKNFRPFVIYCAGAGLVSIILGLVL